MQGRLSPVLAALVAVSCGSHNPETKQPTPPTGGSGSATTVVTSPATIPTPTPAGPPKKLTPVGEKAAAIREAADTLDKAQVALDNGNKNLAEQLFSTAELLVGVDAVAAIAPMFREGAPPRITVATTKVDLKAAPQPKAVGNSEEDDEKAKVPPPPKEGSLSGTLKIGDGKTGGFGLVTLEPASGKFKARAAKHLTLEQRGREFSPHIMAVPVGSTVSFPNFDTVFHNVFSTSPLAAFDLGLYKNGEQREYKFEKEGIVRLGCNLHANMSAYIAIVAAPAYVVTDDKGNFAFKHLPPGNYKLKAWSERSKAPIEQTVTIKVGTNKVDPGVAADVPAGAQNDKFGGKRG